MFKILEEREEVKRDFEECEEVMLETGEGATTRVPVGANKGTQW